MAGAAVAVALGAGAAGAAVPATEVITTILVGENAYGVGLDPATNTVYATNADGGTVSVINGATSTVTTAISVGDESTGVAVNPATSAGYVTNGGNSVSVLGVPVALAGRPAWLARAGPARELVAPGRSSSCRCARP